MDFYHCDADAIDIEELFVTEQEYEDYNDAVKEMFQQIKPIVENNDGSVALNTLLIVLAACGNELDMPPEHFKALVIVELDRLMSIKVRHEH